MAGRVAAVHARDTTLQSFVLCGFYAVSLQKWFTVRSSLDPLMLSNYRRAYHHVNKQRGNHLND